MLYQGKPGGETVSAFSIESWRKYLSGDGPSPIQNLVSGSSGVSRLYQVVQLSDDRSSGRILNVVDASPAAVVAIEAQLEGRWRRTGWASGSRVGASCCAHCGTPPSTCPILCPSICSATTPRVGCRRNTSHQSCVSRAGTRAFFVLTPEPEPDDPELEALLSPPPPPPPPPPADTLTKDPVLICPAQFGTDNDYADLIEGLSARGHPVMVAPLEFAAWFRLIPAALTPEYWKGELDPDVALPFYYEALEEGTRQLREQYPDRKIQLVAHSIGGWIARSYLGQLPDAKRAAEYSALVTLGTPHRPPPDGFFKTIDQTRGLLSYVEQRYPGAFHEELRYLTVGSEAQKGALPGNGAGLVAGSLAYASYLPLCGDGTVVGDGITPLSCAHLDGAEQRNVPAYHIAFVPGSGTRLIGAPWYGTGPALEGWVDFLQ